MLAGSPVRQISLRATHASARAPTAALPRSLSIQIKPPPPRRPTPSKPLRSRSLRAGPQNAPERHAAQNRRPDASEWLRAQPGYLAVSCNLRNTRDLRAWVLGLPCAALRAGVSVRPPGRATPFCRIMCLHHLELHHRHDFRGIIKFYTNRLVLARRPHC